MNQSELHLLLAARKGIPAETASMEELFELRLATNLSLIQQQFFKLYPKDTYTSEFTALLDLLPSLFRERPAELKKLDLARQYETNSPWYLDNKWVGMQLYVDRFSKDLSGLKDRLDYFETLGVNFLHLMPITPRPAGENDGGYAVNDYVGVAPQFGSKEDVLHLTRAMRKKGMALMLDFVVNHTSDEFPWAQKAREGDARYRDYYYSYPDRTLPDAFEKALPEIFPGTSPGNFTYVESMDRWVMTVFNRYQWDLNYSNPKVFLEMLKILSELVNQGVDVVRFDALAFLWKKLGTISQNLPEAHVLISLFKLCLQVVAPGVAILAEAIVAPSDIVKYFGEGERAGNECDIAYNASLMALLWNSIATTKTNLLYRSLEVVPDKPPSATWVNYIRCHDDIGLGYDDKVIREMGWDPKAHRGFLLDYFTQRLPWSPSKGKLFMYNPKTGDGRITGSAASLLGLEHALLTEDAQQTDIAIRKIVMMHGIICSMGGIPMIYAGDELGMTNDYTYEQEQDKAADSRWVNRPHHPWEKYTSGDPVAMRIFKALQKLINLRKEHACFQDREPPIMHSLGNAHVLAYERISEAEERIFILANFDRSEQVVDASRLQDLGYVSDMKFYDLISGRESGLQSALFPLAPYEIFWLKAY